MNEKIQEYIDFLDWKIDEFNIELQEAEEKMKNDPSMIVRVNMRLTQINAIEMCKQEYIELCESKEKREEYKKFFAILHKQKPLDKQK